MSLDDDRELLEAIAWRLTAKVADLRFDPERPLQERMQLAFPYALQELQDVAERLLPEDCEWAAQKQGEKKDKPKTEGKKKEDKPKTDGKKKEDKHKATGVKKVDKNSSPAAAAARAAAMRWAEKKRGGQT